MWRHVSPLLCVARRGCLCAAVTETVPLHRVRHIFGGGTSSRCPRIFPAVTGDGDPPSCSLHIRRRDVVPMSVYFSSGHRGRCPSIVFVTYLAVGHRPDVRAFFQRSPGTVPLHRVRHIFGGGTSSRCPCIFPAVTEDGAPPSCSLHIRWRDVVPMSVYFSGGHRGRCPSIVFVTYSAEGRRPDVRVVHGSVVPLKLVELALVWPILGVAG